MSTIINCREITISQAEYRSLTDVALRHDMLLRYLDEEVDKEADREFKCNYVTVVKTTVEMIAGRKLGSEGRKAKEEEEF